MYYCLHLFVYQEYFLFGYMYICTRFTAVHACMCNYSSIDTNYVLWMQQYIYVYTMYHDIISSNVTMLRLFDQGMPVHKIKVPKEDLEIQ